MAYSTIQYENPYHNSYPASSQRSPLNQAPSDRHAIETWLNPYLEPQDITVQVMSWQSGYLELLVEFWGNRQPDRQPLIRLICHRLCQLKLKGLRGLELTACFADDAEILWHQIIRFRSAASRSPRSAAPNSASLLQRALDPNTYLKLLRSLLLMGSAAAAFMLGCLMTAQEAPSSIAVTESSPVPIATPSLPPRPPTVQAALDVVPVVQLNNPANAHDPAITLMFGGDVTLADAFQDKVAQNYPWAFANLHQYRQADVAMVNLEGTLTTAALPISSQDFPFKSPPESVQVLTEGGVDIVNLSNDHALDYEAPGLKDTIATLEQAGIQAVGAGQDVREARRPEILEVKGKRIAYLGYSDADLQLAAGENTPGINIPENDRIAADIQAIRNQVDWVVVNYHWGEELAEHPTDTQISLARFTIDQGADLVVGHHPHVLQGAEIYKGRPIVYSLGNFIFGGKAVSDYDTAVLKVALRDQQMKVDLLPVEVREYQPQIIQGDRGQQILARVEQLSSNFSQPMPTSVIMNARTAEVITSTAADSPTTSGLASSPADSFIHYPSPSADSNADAQPLASPTLSPSATPLPESPLEERAVPESTAIDAADSTPTAEPEAIAPLEEPPATPLPPLTGDEGLPPSVMNPAL